MAPGTKSALIVAAVFAGSIVMLIGVISAMGTSEDSREPRPVLGTIAVRPGSSSTEMDFADCLRSIRRTSEELGVAPINIVETDSVRIVRYNAVNGSVLITCSREDARMVVTVSGR